MLHKRIVDKSVLGSLLRKELKRSSSNDVERDTQSEFVRAGRGPRSQQANWHRAIFSFQLAADSGQRTVKRPRTEDRGQTTDDRDQRSEVRGQKSECEFRIADLGFAVIRSLRFVVIFCKR